MPAAIGYQVQRTDDLDNGDWYTPFLNSDEEAVVSGTTYYAPAVGFETAYFYRVRAVFSESSVSEWTVSTGEAMGGNVLYEVEGSATTASVTYETSSGTQQTNIDVPLTSTDGDLGLLLQASNMTPYLSAQATSSGTITCRITLKGEVVAESTVSGLGSIATCSP